MEWKIGEIKQVNGEWYQCIKGDTCADCAFNKEPCNQNPLYEAIGSCEYYREDATSVVFKKLEKVGEPYMLEDKKFQKYRIFKAPYIYNKIDYSWQSFADPYYVSLEIKQTNEDMKENKLNLKPFDIQKAREGKPVCTRDGKKARIICFDTKGNMPIIALITINESGQEYPATYDNEGRFSKDESTKDLDLMMLPEKRSGWVKIRKDINLYDTKEEADRKMIGNDEYVTAKVCWEE